MSEFEGRLSLEQSKEEELRKDFYALRDPEIGQGRILDRLTSGCEEYLQRFYSISKEVSSGNNSVYPSQGLLHTEYDGFALHDHRFLPEEKVREAFRASVFFLMMFNHPYRMLALNEVNSKPFRPPPKVESVAVEWARKTGGILSIGELAASVRGGNGDRISRNERYAKGPFVKLGRQARIPFVGSESPDVWNSTLAVATMAASHSIATIPRNGIMKDIPRQADFAKEVFEYLDVLGDLILGDRADRGEILSLWRKNVAVTLEPTAKKALERAEAAYKMGVRAFRVYSPEPGNAIVNTTSELRRVFGDEVEIFTGQIVEVDQAKKAEEAGANLIVLGVAGGGRCITGPRSGTGVDWPILVFDLRGEVNLGVVVQGGGSDHVGETLLLGASGIGVSRAVAGGTIESPGGVLFCVDSEGNYFKPYGGEASARMKFLEGKMLPFDIPSFVEGETTAAEISYIRYTKPTLTCNLHLLLEDAILSLIFRGARDIPEVHAINPSPLGLIGSAGKFQMGTH